MARSSSAPADLRQTVLAVCGWCGPLTILVTFTGWLIAGVLPFPLGPSDSPDEVVAFYGDGMHVSIGFVIATLGISLVIPLIAAISHLMLTGTPESRLLSVVQLVSGSVTAVLLLVPMLIMAVIAFRPVPDPALAVLLNDLAWLLFITPVAPFIIQNLAIAASALRDPASPFPGWLGYLNCWIAFTFSFDVLALVFKHGPFTWNGVLIFWLALTTYSIFLLAMGLMVRHRATDRATEEVGLAP
ncbi:hypothetical protein [Mycolicibacterium elephantis]|uniref:DUF4386 domain-containing protein n=1 Tax=Mycolicibacterium elephantis DSM 44368 TaxID=1335622 RepID=A0A439DRH7_9MYCO|nr:hypothetical protein [Mycolicibacterium elephantis]MCV7221729.1 hypothetical protein [Mycolicibacterium elephantis]RWA18783.1 hypothetical protein MELE44368_03885 [Mycolicibacterium elephantis DSM 44368]